MRIEDVSHIQKAEKAKVGTTNLDAIKVERIKI
jgi:hypothetical protein